MSADGQPRARDIQQDESPFRKFIALAQARIIITVLLIIHLTASSTANPPRLCSVALRYALARITFFRPELT